MASQGMDLLDVWVTGRHKRRLGDTTGTHIFWGRRGSTSRRRSFRSGCPADGRSDPSVLQTVVQTRRSCRRSFRPDGPADGRSDPPVLQTVVLWVTGRRHKRRLGDTTGTHIFWGRRCPTSRRRSFRPAVLQTVVQTRRSCRRSFRPAGPADGRSDPTVLQTVVQTRRSCRRSFRPVGPADGRSDPTVVLCVTGR